MSMHAAYLHVMPDSLSFSRSLQRGTSNMKLYTKAMPLSSKHCLDRGLLLSIRRKDVHSESAKRSAMYYPFQFCRYPRLYCELWSMLIHGRSASLIVWQKKCSGSSVFKSTPCFGTSSRLLVNKRLPTAHKLSYSGNVVLVVALIVRLV